MLHGTPVFRILYRSAPGHNLLFSPLSVSPLLALLWAGTRGEARTAVHEFMGLEIDADPEAMLFRLAADLKSLREGLSHAEYQLSSAFWFHGERLRLHPAFKSWFHEVFDIHVRREDFRRDSGAQERLNDWCALVTRGNMDHLPFPSRPIWVPPEQPYPLFLCANALHLRAPWKTPFYTYRYETDFFHCQDGEERELFFMVRDHFAGEAEVAYFSHARFEGVQIPFADERLVMEVFLPRDVDGLDGMLAKFDFANPGQWSDEFQPCAAIFLMLPIFETAIRVPFTYGELGKVFAPLLRPGQDFDGLFEKAREGERLGLSDLVQAATLRVELNGVGVEAIPATFASPVSEADKPAAEGRVFVADHPFCYRIRDLETGRVLFLGTFCQPNRAAEWPRPITDGERWQRRAYRRYLHARGRVAKMPLADLLGWARGHLLQAARRYRLRMPAWEFVLNVLERGSQDEILEWHAFWQVLGAWANLDEDAREARELVAASAVAVSRLIGDLPEGFDKFVLQALRAPAVLRTAALVYEIRLRGMERKAERDDWPVRNDLLWEICLQRQLVF